MEALACTLDIMTLSVLMSLCLEHSTVGRAEEKAGRPARRLTMEGSSAGLVRTVQ